MCAVCFRSGNPFGESSENTGNCKQIQQTIQSCLIAALEKTNLAMEDTHVYNASYLITFMAICPLLGSIPRG